MPDAGTIAIDVGGTFTDITFADAGTGRSAPDILRVFHGTTTATNALVYQQVR